MNEKKLTADEIVVLGVPFDKNSSFQRGVAFAPHQIREALFSDSTNLWTEKSIDLEPMSGWQILDDLEFNNRKMAFEQIESKINELLNKKARVISLGGDHSITYPIIRAYGKRYSELSILQLDAHPDLYGIYRLYCNLLQALCHRKYIVW